MLIGIEGGLGSGKTIMMLRYLMKDYNNGHSVYANFGIKGIKYNPIDLNELLEYSKSEIDLTDATIGIDEITVAVDCRTSMAKRNRVFSYFVLQSRKRNVSVYFTTQDLGMIDKRLTQHTHVIVLCDFVYNKHNKKLRNYRKYNVFDFRNPRHVTKKSFIMDISKYYAFYDTNEIIKPVV